MISSTLLVANSLNKSNSYMFTLHYLLKLLAVPLQWDFGLKNTSHLSVYFGWILLTLQQLVS